MLEIINGDFLNHRIYAGIALCERNFRIFQHVVHDGNYVLHKVEEVVREATWFWRVKRTDQNWKCVKNGVLMRIKFLVSLYSSIGRFRFELIVSDVFVFFGLYTVFWP